MYNTKALPALNGQPERPRNLAVHCLKFLALFVAGTVGTVISFLVLAFLVGATLGLLSVYAGLPECDAVAWFHTVGGLLGRAMVMVSPVVGVVFAIVK